MNTDVYTLMNVAAIVALLSGIICQILKFKKISWICFVMCTALLAGIWVGLLT